MYTGRDDEPFSTVGMSQASRSNCGFSRFTSWAAVLFWLFGSFVVHAQEFPQPQSRSFSRTSAARSRLEPQDGFTSNAVFQNRPASRSSNSVQPGDTTTHGDGFYRRPDAVFPASRFLLNSSGQNSTPEKQTPSSNSSFRQNSSWSASSSNVFSSSAQVNSRPPASAFSSRSVKSSPVSSPNRQGRRTFSQASQAGDRSFLRQEQLQQKQPPRQASPQLPPPGSAFSRNQKGVPKDAGAAQLSRSPSSAVGLFFWKTLVAFGFVLGLVFVAALFLKKHGNVVSGKLPEEAVELLGRRPIDREHSILLVRCGSRILVLGLSSGEIRTLAEITDPVEVDMLAGLCRRPPHPAGQFFEHVASVLQRHYEPTETTKSPVKDSAGSPLPEHLSGDVRASSASPSPSSHGSPPSTSQTAATAGRADFRSTAYTTTGTSPSSSSE